MIMSEQILLNNESYTFTESNFPCLITYEEKMGGSHLTMAIMANLFLNGSKILCFTAYPMAKENFLNQTKDKESHISLVTKVEEITHAQNSQAIILESGNEKLFKETIKSLSDLNERIVLVKNIETFSHELITECLQIKKIILSGHIDKCVLKDTILKKNFETIIAFNQPETLFPIEVPKLERYHAFLSNKDKSGIITLKII